MNILVILGIFADAENTVALCREDPPQSSAHGSSINDGLNWAEIAFGLLVGTSLFSTHTNLASCGEQSWARLALLLTWGHAQVSWLTLRGHSWVVTFPPGIVCSGFLLLCSPGSTPLLPAHSQLQPLCSAPAPGWALVLFQSPGLWPLGHKGGWHCNLISISVSYFRLFVGYFNPDPLLSFQIPMNVSEFNRIGYSLHSLHFCLWSYLLISQGGWKSLGYLCFLQVQPISRSYPVFIEW